MLPTTIPSNFKHTLNELALSAYDNVKVHMTEKFGERVKIFDEKVRVDKMFMVGKSAS
jgi:hypothetical protein